MPEADDRLTSKMRIKCPHCGSTSYIRTSRELSPLSRELYFECKNIRCRHAWRSLLSAICTIVPSNNPNPEIFIPLSDKCHPATASPTG